MDEQTSNSEKNDIKSGTAGGKLIFKDIILKNQIKSMFHSYKLGPKTMHLYNFEFFKTKVQTKMNKE